ncbi:beta-glucanase [Chitinispirillum alkaliphilum]|nr:beta-glucanase [Chitinispirillum alkaliphilum]
MNKLKNFGTILMVSALLLKANPPMMEAFVEEFPATGEQKEMQYFRHDTGGGDAHFTWRSGVPSQTEPHTTVLALTMDPADLAGAWMGPNVYTPNLCHFGTYVTRLRIPDASSQPNVGSVVGFYTFYNDEWRDDLPNDINQSGLYDNSEIDFEWLIADPRIIYIGAYTDYGPTPETIGTENPVYVTRQISRAINLATGEIYHTKHIDSEPLGSAGTPLTSPEENTPASIESIEDFDASARFHTYGFDWLPESIRWWMLHPQTKDTVILWDYHGPQERITQKPANLMINIWHTNDWPVIGNPHSFEPPNDTFTVEIDWVSYTPYDQNDDTRSKAAGSLHHSRAPNSGFSLVSHTKGTMLLREENSPAKIMIYNLQGTLMEKFAITESQTLLSHYKVPVVVWMRDSSGNVFTRRLISQKRGK